MLKNVEDIYNRLDRIPSCDRRTDILRWHSPHYAYASRGKDLSTGCRNAMLNRGCVLGWSNTAPAFVSLATCSECNGVHPTGSSRPYAEPQGRSYGRMWREAVLHEPGLVAKE